MSQPRLRAMPRLPHKPVRKKVDERKRGPSFDTLLDEEVAALLSGDQPRPKCSIKRGMISTKLQGR